jgi:hypothetical protein
MEVRERLAQLGIDTETIADEVIDFACHRVDEHIKNVCNLSYVPTEAELLAVDMACAYIIGDRVAVGMLGDFDARGALKAITEGDVKLEYDTDGEADAMTTLINTLNRGESELYRFRKICW